MSIKLADKRKRALRLLPRDFRERGALERTLIQKSMRKWESMDEAGRRLGRGLGKKELIGRVAREVDASLREVYCALRAR